MAEAPASACLPRWRVAVWSTSYVLCVLTLCVPVRGQEARESGIPLGQHLTLSGSLRVRAELRRDLRFDPGLDRDYLLGRLRVRLTGGVRRLRGVVEIQDSRSPWLSPSSPSLRDPADIHQGYVDVGRRDDAIRLRVGRQELAYGTERLISRNNWRNTGRSFDAVRVFLQGNRLGVDLFAAAEVERDPTGLNPVHESGDLFGAYGWLEHLPAGIRLEPYLLRRSLPSALNRDTLIGAERRHTVGTRAVRETSTGLNFTTEIALQSGNTGGQRIDAWFGSGIVAYGLRGRGQPRVSFELTEASGDAETTDDRNATFDPMYPTGHAHFGFADIFSGRNLRDARVGLQIEPASRLTLRVDAHGFWLSSPQDGLYASSLQNIVSPRPGNRATRVGTELDVTVRFSLSPTMRFGGGSGHLFPGRFLEEHTSGGTSRYSYAFVDLGF